MLIRMSVGMSGGRHDDQRWPELHGTIEVPDWEGIELTRGGMAVPEGGAAMALWREYRGSGIWQAHEFLAGRQAPPQPEPEAAPVVTPQVSPVAQASPVAEVSGPIAPPEPATVVPEPELAPPPLDPEDEPPQPAVRPAPSAPKQAWIDYAVTQGADVHEASAMTKVDLMSRYGGRL